MMTEQIDYNQAIQDKEDILDRMHVASFEVYQEIMEKYVKEVLKRAYPLAEEVIAQIEKLEGEKLDTIDRDSIVGILATGIWAEISSNLQRQIAIQTVTEEILQ